MLQGTQKKNGIGIANTENPKKLVVYYMDL